MHPVTIYPMRTCLSSHQPMATSYLDNLTASPSTISHFMFIAPTGPYESRVTHTVTIYTKWTCFSSHQPMAPSCFCNPAAPSTSILHIGVLDRLPYMGTCTPVRVTRHTHGYDIPKPDLYQLIFALCSLIRPRVYCSRHNHIGP